MPEGGGIVTWRRLDMASLRLLFTRLGSASWSWSVSEVPALAERMHWDVRETIDGLGAVADGGFEVGDKQIVLTFDAGHVDDIMIWLTETIEDPPVESQVFLYDTFTDAVDAATDVLGPPTGRTSGESPAAHWRGPESTIQIRHAEFAVAVVWASNEYQDEWDQVIKDLA
ncbi:DUF6301 family protein [Micromonospora sp. NPDC049048]|uniref:DUF6301 family protein n=1 Tax=Micromonospora sp. NPDC049048 TaxID=3364263 RepID=UPI003715ABA7